MGRTTLYFYSVLALSLLPVYLNAQDSIQVSGRVFEFSTGAPIEGAWIMAEQKNGLDTLAKSDSSGYFAVELYASSIQIAHPAFQTQRFDQLTNGQVLRVGLGGLVVTATSFQARRITFDPLPRWVVDEDLATQSSTTLTDAMNTRAGIFVQEGNPNTQRITSRGIGNRSPFSTTRIRAYFDQIPLTNGSGETLLEDLSPISFHRATFIKGPRETRYGTPLGGNFLIESLPEGTASTQGSVNVSGGSFGLINVNGDLLLGNQKGDLHRFSAGFIHFDGYRENNNYDRQQAQYSGKVVHKKRHQETRFLLGFNKLDAQIPSSLGRTAFLENPRQAAFTWGRIMGFEDYYRLIGGLSHKIRLVDRNTLSLENTTSLFGQYRDNYELRPFNLLQEQDGWYGFRTLFSLSDSAQWSIDLGGEFFFEDYAWTTNDIVDLQPDTLLSDNREKRRHINLFAQGQAHWGSFSATLGAGLQFSRYDYEDQFLIGPDNRSADFSFTPIFSPSLTLEYAIKRGSVYANVSRGFALPTLEETLLPDGQRNPDIQPETGWNFELGVSQNRLWKRLDIAITLYHIRAENLLVARRTAEDAFISVNAGSSTHTGLETNGSFQLIINNPNALYFSWMYTYNDHRFKEFIDDQNDFSGNELTGSPPHNVLFALDYSFKNSFDIGLQYRFVDAFPMNDGNTVYSDAYHLLNLRLEYHWRNRSSSPLNAISAFVLLQNLTDNQYASMISVNAVGFGGNEPRYYYPGLPFNFRAGLRVKFGKS